MISWKEVTLESVCSRISSGKSISSKFINEKYKFPVYGGNGIRGYAQTFNFDGECAIIGRQGAYCGNVRYFKGKAYMTEHAVVVCAKPNNDTRYLAYALSKMGLGRLSGQSAQPGLSVKTLSKQIIKLPPLEIQEKCSRLLRIFEEKIELNQKINENLEQQAKTLFTKMIIEDADASWTPGILSDIATVTMGQSPKGETYNEEGVGTVFFQGRAEFGFRFPTRRLFTTDPKRMAKANDALMSVRAPVGDMNVAYEDCCIGRGLASIRSKGDHQSFVLYTMLNLREELNVFNGEGTVFGSINQDALKSMPISIPPIRVRDEFEIIVSPIDAAIRNNYDEILRLEAIRDNLLPKLMSGELDVSGLDL